MAKGVLKEEQRWRDRSARECSGRNRLGVCRCGHGRYQHNTMPDDPRGLRDEWGPCPSCDCELYEFAAPTPPGSKFMNAKQQGTIPVGARVRWVGPGRDYRRPGESRGVVLRELDSGMYEPCYTVKWDSGNESYSHWQSELEPTHD
jgi:hypothetical protein